MNGPPLPRCLRCTVGVFLLGTAVLVGPAAAQQPGAELHPLVMAIGSMLGTLVVGGGLILFKPTYTARTTDHVREHPVATFFYGFVISVLLLVVVVVLYLTVVGMLLLIPVAIAVVIFGELGFLAAGRTVSPDWTVALFVAMLVAAFAGGVPILGTVVGWSLSTMGLGAAYVEWTNVDSPGTEPADHTRGRHETR